MPAYTNARPNVPKIFQEIMKNDTQRGDILAKGADMTTADWKRLKELAKDKKDNLRPGAEKALRWNTDKGNTA